MNLPTHIKSKANVLSMAKVHKKQPPAAGAVDLIDSLK